MDGFAGSPGEPQAPQDDQNGDFFAEEQQQPQKVIQNSTPAFLQNCFYLVTGCLESYGWFIVLGAILLVFLWYKFQPFLIRLLKKWEEQQEIANFDPEKAAELETNVDRTRQRWQEIQDAKAAKYAEERKKADEQKRQELIEDWDRHQQGKGYKSKKFKSTDESRLAEKVLKPKKKNDEKNKPLRPTDYSPLSGGGGSCSWRPTRRGGGG